MRGGRAVVGLAASLWLTAAPGPARGAQAVERLYAVEAPGAGRLRLTLPAAELGSGALDVRGPDGAAVEQRVVLDAVAAGVEVEAQVVGVREEEAGWVVELDTGQFVTGPRSLAHRRVVFALARARLAPRVELEGSADGEVWAPLATGDLFRIGAGSGLEGAALDYPASAVRHLRLHWPRAAGFPEVRRAAVESAGPVYETLALETDCGEAGFHTLTCELRTAGAGHLDHLVLEVASEPGGFRLFRPEAGRWELAQEGAWPAETAPTRVPAGLWWIEKHPCGSRSAVPRPCSRCGR